MMSDRNKATRACLVLNALLFVMLLAGCAQGDNQSATPTVAPTETKMMPSRTPDVATPAMQPNRAEVRVTDAMAAIPTAAPGTDGAPTALPGQHQATNNSYQDPLGLRHAPRPPPLSKWVVDRNPPDRLVTFAGVDYLASAPMKTQVNGIAMEVLATSISGDTARVFVSIQRPGQGKGPGGKRAAPILPAVARLAGEDGRSVHDSQRIELITEFNGLTLALISLPLTGNQSPRLSLDVSAMHVGPPENALEHIPGVWRIPLLIDNFPGQEQAESSIGTDILPHSYDSGVQVRVGDTMETPFGMFVGYPRVGFMAGDLAEAWVFTLTSADGQETVLYLIVMADGSVRQVSKATYDAVLNATIFAPNPTPVVAPNVGPVPPNFPTPLPFYTPDVSRPMEDVIKEHAKDLTPTPPVP